LFTEIFVNTNLTQPRRGKTGSDIPSWNKPSPGTTKQMQQETSGRSLHISQMTSLPFAVFRCPWYSYWRWNV